MSEFAIPFTQYVLPNGIAKPEIYTHSDSALQERADALLAEGYRFEAEILSNGFCSFTIVDDNSDEGDVAIKVCPNGSSVVDAVRSLIMDYQP